MFGGPIFQSKTFEGAGHGAVQAIRPGFNTARETHLGNSPFLRALLPAVALEVAVTGEYATGLGYRVSVRSRELDRLDVSRGLVEDVAWSRCRSAKECDGEVGELHVVWCGGLG